MLKIKLNGLLFHKMIDSLEVPKFDKYATFL